METNKPLLTERTRNKGQHRRTLFVDNNDPIPGDLSVAADHHLAIEGWKARKKQLYKQQKSVANVIEETERINLVSKAQQSDRAVQPSS
jgi:hypothetical protein